MLIFKGKPTKDGRCYYFRKSKNNKQYTSRKYKTREECQKALSMFVLKNDNPMNIRFDLVSEDYFKDLQSRKKLSTYYSYKTIYQKNILPFFKTKYINKITVKDLNEWKDTMLSKNYSLNHLNNMYSLLNSIFKFACKNYSIGNNPVQLIGRFEKRNDKVLEDRDRLRYITLNDFNKFINVIEDNTWRTFFIFAFYTGMRKGEIQALTWKDVNFNKKEITVSKTLASKTIATYKITNTKNAHNRIIKMSNILYNNLKEYKKQQQVYTDFTDEWFVFGGPIHLASTTIDINTIIFNYLELTK